MLERFFGISLLVLLVIGSGCSTGRMTRSRTQARVASVERWLCYYGADRNVLSAPGLQMLILDADSLGSIADEDKAGRICLAYLSIGEANDYRGYWDAIKDADWLLGENPNWEGDHLIDPRSREWQEFVLDKIAPALLEAGYDGFMLDTLDTAETLLAADPVKYKGADKAVAKLIKRLRKKFPRAIIISNRGLSIFQQIENSIDGVLIEDVRSMYDFRRKHSRRLTKRETIWVDDYLLDARISGLPIFVLDYVDPPAPFEAKEIYQILQQEGYLPFISTLDLMHYTHPYVWSGP